MANIPIGTTREEKLLVTSEVAINFLGLDTARVLATPYMIGFMERTCRNLVLPYLEPGHDTVGTHVDVYHRAAAPMGASLTFRAEIIAVEDRRVRFKVEARDEERQRIIGDGTHERGIVNIARFAARLQEAPG
jgi:fluoroacetyl-CoA thioesterase